MNGTIRVSFILSICLFAATPTILHAQSLADDIRQLTFDYQKLAQEKTILSDLPSENLILLTGLPVPLPLLRATARALEHKKSSLRHSAHSDGLRLRLHGAYIRDSLQWLVLKVTSHSRLPYKIDQVRFYFQDKKTVKRKAIQETPLSPVFTDNPSTAYPAPQTSSTDTRSTPFAAAFQPMHTIKGKQLMIEVSTSDGRTVTLCWKKWYKKW